MSLHISMRYYPPASQKTLPPMCQKGGPPATFWYVVSCLVTVITAGEMSLVHTFYMERDIFFSKNRGGDGDLSTDPSKVFVPLLVRASLALRSGTGS